MIRNEIINPNTGKTDGDAMNRILDFFFRAGSTILFL